MTRLSRPTTQQQMSNDEPKLRQKHVANEKKKDKGPIFASQKHVRIELENQWRHEKNVSKK